MQRAMRTLRALAASTAFRWTLAIAGGFTAMAMALFAFIYWQTAVHEQGRIDGIVLSEARSIADAPGGEAVSRLEAWLADDPHGVRYGGLFGPDGARAAGNILGLPAGLPADGMAHRAEIGPVGRDRDGDWPEVVRGVAQRLGDGRLGGGRLLVLGYDIDELDEVREIVLRALGLGLAPAVLLSLAGGVLLARRGQRRIAAVHEAVGRIMQGQLRERLPVHGASDELDKVAAAVNGMLDRIEQLVEEIRGVGDSIAHDLRTPLTRVRTRLERSRDEARTREEFQAAADRAITSVDQALAVVSAVLRIGEIEHGKRRAAFGPVDLAGVLRDAAELYEPVAEEKGVALRLRLLPGGGPAPRCEVPGDRDLLLEAVGNLVDNAIKFTPAGTAVTLSLRCEPGAARLSVADQGPGIPLAERERVLQRFYRTEKSRTVEGSGLGLSLVAAVVALHGFRLRIDAAEPGGGVPGCLVEVACLYAPASPSGRCPSRLAEPC
jgi:signal transduction histidine kinase